MGAVTQLPLDLERNKEGGAKSSYANFERIILKDHHLQDIYWDSFINQIAVAKGNKLPWKHPGGAWTNQDLTRLCSYISRNYEGIHSQEKTAQAVEAIALERQKHPIKAYLSALPAWDGTPRLDTLLVDYLGADNTDYVHAATRKAFVAAVRRVKIPGCKFDNVLTLVGGQGIGKSTLVANMSLGYFDDSLRVSDMHNKSAAEKLNGAWIVEIAELSGMRKAESEAVKSFITTREDRYRPAYGRYVQTIKRQSILIGTTNAENGFLKDQTGNRRWWPVQCHGNATHSPFDMDDELIGQLWAEALYYEQQGESLFLEGDTAKAAEEIQSQFVETDDRAETVSEYLDKELPTGWQDMTIPERKNYLQTKFLPKRLGDNSGFEQRQFVSVKEIWVECFDNKIGDLKKHDSNEIAGILKSLGWTPTGNPRRLGAYGQQRVYERPAP